MSDQSEVLRFEQQKQITKLSQAIREGLSLVRETAFSHYGCALGLASQGLTGRRLAENIKFDICNGYTSYQRFIADSTGTPVQLVYDIEHAHMRGESARSLVDKLEALGY